MMTKEELEAFKETKGLGFFQFKWESNDITELKRDEIDNEKLRLENERLKLMIEGYKLKLGNYKSKDMIVRDKYG